MNSPLVGWFLCSTHFSGCHLYCFLVRVFCFAVFEKGWSYMFYYVLFTICNVLGVQSFIWLLLAVSLGVWNFHLYGICMYLQHVGAVQLWSLGAAPHPTLVVWYWIHGVRNCSHWLLLYSLWFYMAFAKTMERISPYQYGSFLFFFLPSPYSIPSNKQENRKNKNTKTYDLLSKFK